ncbi:hypothetical protein PF003_g18960 [Phytophthora fragariae]|nr:hypothetical protein PF003_g18960 [Phytophthora fragariae]
MRFTLSVKHLRVGLSFRQTAAVIQQHYNVTGNSKLYGMTDAMTGTYARILVAYSFQRISNLIADPNMWGFAFACDITTHTDRSFIDQRVRVAVDSVLVNLHLLAIPMFDRHTAVVQVRLIVRVLDILSANWRDKLIGISSDGENTMTGRHGGVVTLLEKEATHSVLRVWCAAHQMDLVMKAGFAIFGSGDFVKKTKDLIVHLRRQKKLSTEMGGAAKKLTNRWLYMGNALQWIVTNHFRLEEHLGENEAVAPTPSWWVNAAVVCGITVVVNVTFVKIQGKDVLLSQQMAEIELLVDSLRKLLQVQPVPSSEFESSAIDTISTKYWLQEQHLLEFIHYQGTFIKHNMNSLGDADKSSVLRQLGKFVLHIIEGMELVQAERDSNNEAAASPAPPVLPTELVTVPPRQFAEDILNPRRDQLALFWNEAQIEAVEREHRELCQANLLDELVCTALDEESYETSFNDAWDSVQKAAAPKTFSHLRQFCCGLATVFANTASVESDFPVLKWELNDRRTSLTSLALEGIFQAKQFNMLEKL